MRQSFISPVGCRQIFSAVSCPPSRRACDIDQRDDRRMKMSKPDSGWPVSRRAALRTIVTLPLTSMALEDPGEPSPRRWWPPAGMRKLFAQGMAEGMADYELAVRERKRVLFSGLKESDRILDVGIGAAPNLPYLPTGVKVVGLDPNEFMTPFAQKAADRLSLRGIQLDMRQGDAEDIPFPDNSFDVVIATLVLCSVRNPEKAIQEIHRVLVPGGKFMFIEHVIAKSGGLRYAQSLFSPLQVLAADGCHLNRDTERLIRDYEPGFESVDIENFKVDSGVAGALISTQISGVAVKHVDPV